MNKDRVARKILYRMNTQINHQGTNEGDIKMDISMCGNSIYTTPNPLQMKDIYSGCDDQKIIFHTYWYGKFDRKQAFSIKSLLATQKKYPYVVWLWLDEETLHENNQDNKYVRELDDFIEVKYYSPKKAADSRGFEKLRILMEEDSYLAYRADAFRIWALHEYGGVYFDLDMMFLKDMQNLFCQEEFVYAWEKQKYANNALIYLRKNSCLNDYLLSKVRKRMSFQPWILFDYGDTKLKYLKLYNSFLFDPLWGNDTKEFAFHTFADFFKTAPSKCYFSEAFPYSYAYHWHNHWKEPIERFSYFEQFEKQFENILGIDI